MTSDLDYLKFIGIVDSLSVRYEGLKGSVVKKLVKTSGLKQFKSYSDDTQLSLRFYKALLHSKVVASNTFDIQKSKQLFLSELRYWMLSMPPHLGKATLISGLRACLGATNTGAYSAGNGALMRIGVLSRFFDRSDLENPAKVQELALLAAINTRVTHTHPHAIISSIWHAFLGVWFKDTNLSHSIDSIVADIRLVQQLLESVLQKEGPTLLGSTTVLTSSELQNILGTERILKGLEEGHSLEKFVSNNKSIYNNAVLGYCVHTSIVAVYQFLEDLLKLNSSFLSSFNVMNSVLRIVKLGGDTDTVSVVYAHLIASALMSKFGKEETPGFIKDVDKVDYYQELTAEFLGPAAAHQRWTHSAGLISKNMYLLLMMMTLRVTDLIKAYLFKA